MKNIEYCVDKIKQIDADIQALKLNNDVIKRFGKNIANLDDEIAFQQKRIDILEWAKNATEAEIHAKIKEQTEILPIELKKPIRYLSNKLPEYIYEVYCLRQILVKVVI
jgi:predicted RNase H-like nuclease (RuvC/YqgF family)